MDAVTRFLPESWKAITPAGWCQAFFILSTAGLLGAQALPQDLSGALLSYGARRGGAPNQGKATGANGKAAPAASSSTEKDEEKLAGGLRGLVVKLSDNAQVPHGWFLHFYIVAVGWSLFWATQYVSRGAVMKGIAATQARAGDPSMELGQVLVAWALITMQGLRRLYECLFVTKPGTSPMLALHWMLGLAYYTFNVFSVWIEGSGAILESWDSSSSPIRLLTPRTTVGGLLFLFASYKQNECHRYLASLKKYTLPDKGWFRYIICPHYTSECLVYVAMSIITAPPGTLINRTVLCGLVFAAGNIGMTAHGTKRWYAEKFGADKVAGRWKMIPLVY